MLASCVLFYVHTSILDLEKIYRNYHSLYSSFWTFFWVCFTEEIDMLTLKANISFP